jgi:hypothetical protein
VAGKQNIGGSWKNDKAVNHARFVVAAIARSDCQPIQRLRIETVLHRCSASMRCGCPGEADAEAREAARFGERLNNEQIRIQLDQWDRAIRTEIDIGLVDDDDRDK